MRTTSRPLFRVHVSYIVLSLHIELASLVDQSSRAPLAPLSPPSVQVRRGVQETSQSARLKERGCPTFLTLFLFLVLCHHHGHLAESPVTLEPPSGPNAAWLCQLVPRDSSKCAFRPARGSESGEASGRKVLAEEAHHHNNTHLRLCRGGGGGDCHEERGAAGVIDLPCLDRCKRVTS